MLHLGGILEKPMRAYDFAVIGAGVFGAWIARELRRWGASVLLVDAWGPAHTRASSGGESRIIRMGYGADEIYTRMAMRSLARWREFLEDAGQPLFHRTGVLWMAREGEPYSEATRCTLERAGVRHTVLNAADLARRYPQMAIPDPQAFGIFEPDSGVLMARRAVAAVVEDFLRRGGEWAACAVRAPSADGVFAANGEAIRAGTFVFACGAWLGKLFPGLLETRIFPTRQEVFFFRPHPGDTRFASPELPVWLDFTDPRAPYGFPDLEGRGVKVAFDRHGGAFDPDSDDRQVTAAGLAAARQFLGERFPSLANAPLSESRVCQYENTSNGDFLIDRHPDFENIWIAGGGSGHGFKHGPAVGEYVRGVLLEGAPAEPRFALATKLERQQRTVH